MTTLATPTANIFCLNCGEPSMGTLCTSCAVASENLRAQRGKRAASRAAARERGRVTRTRSLQAFDVPVLEVATLTVDEYERKLAILMPHPHTRDAFLRAVRIKAASGEPFLAAHVENAARYKARNGLGARLNDALEMDPRLERVARPGGAPGGARQWRRREGAPRDLAEALEWAQRSARS